jgi:DNA invertase Pin-like site-specific DNA recombinase
MARYIQYVRVSSKTQALGGSLEIQERDGKAHVAANGGTWVDSEHDTESAHYVSSDDREGFQRVLGRIRAGEADTVLVWRIDRSNREQIDGAKMLGDIFDAGGIIESINPPLRFENTALGKMLFNQFIAQAEMEWENLQARTRMGKQARLERGSMFASIPLYGYVFRDEAGKYGSKSTYVIDGEESGPVVRDIFAKADAGWSGRDICNWLTGRGIKTPSQLLASRGQLGRRHLAPEWTPQMVLDILCKVSYTGKHAARRSHVIREKKTGENGKKTNVSRQQLRAVGDEAIVPHDIPALVDTATWERVRAQISARQQEWSKDAVILNEPLLNKGIAICGHCGATMITAKHHSGNYRLYACQRRSGKSSEALHTCSGGAFAVRADVVDADTWEKTKEIMRNQPQYERLIQSKAQQLTELRDEAIRRKEVVDGQIEETRRNLEAVYHQMTYETRDWLKAMHLAELERLKVLLAGLEEKSAAYFADILGIIDRKTTYEVVKEFADALWADADQIGMPRPQVSINGEVLKDPLDEISRQDKRRFMRAFGVQVLCYSTTSEYAKTHDNRWQFKIPDSSVSVPSHESTR